MSIFADRSQRWQGDGGPPEWVAAWDRTRALLAPHWPDRQFAYDRDPDSSTIADGAAGLATALYLVAREQSIPVSEVHRPDIEDLAHPKPGERRADIPRRWEARLHALGHDLESSTDPVSARWQILRIDWPEPYHLEDYGLTRQGPGVLDGLDSVLSPRMNLQL